MNIFEQEFRSGIDTAIRDLFSDKDKYHKIDVDTVARVITDFVLEREHLDTVSDANYFEAYHQALGRAVAITQGWKLNGAEEVNLPSETAGNVKNYMLHTYGAQVTQ